MQSRAGSSTSPPGVGDRGSRLEVLDALRAWRFSFEPVPPQESGACPSHTHSPVLSSNRVSAAASLAAVQRGGLLQNPKARCLLCKTRGTLVTTEGFRELTQVRYCNKCSRHFCAECWGRESSHSCVQVERLSSVLWAHNLLPEEEHEDVLDLSSPLGVLRISLGKLSLEERWAALELKELLSEESDLEAG